MIERIESTFRASLYLVFTLSTLCIGFAEGQFFPHFLTLPLILVAYLYLDRKPILQLESGMTSVLGIAALVVAIFEFQQGRVNVEMRILSASHLLAYFSWIVLIIEKESQQYWWLLALSVLNMAVSASLTNASLLGLAVILYLFGAAWTLSLFTAFRGTSALRPQGRGANPPGSSPPAAKAAASPAASKTGPPTNMVDVSSSSRVRGGFQFDPKDNWIGYRLVSNVAFLSFASLAVGMCIFTMTPRIWIGNWNLPSSDISGVDDLGLGKSVSGFTKTVQLGDMGEILENPTPVMEVTFQDAENRMSLTLDDVLRKLGRDELLFRGTALKQYESGRWDEDDWQTNLLPVDTNLKQQGGVLFVHELEPIGRSTIFGVHPVNSGLNRAQDALRPDLAINPFSLEMQVASRQTQFASVNTIRYSIVSVPPEGLSRAPFHALPMPETRNDAFRQSDEISAQIEEDYQADGIRGILTGESENTDADESWFSPGQWGREGREGLGSRAQGFRYFDSYLRTLVDIDRDNLRDLVNLAEQLSRDADGNLLDPEERCLAIFRYFRDPNRFSYSLNMSITDPTIDPVEDFIFNRKSGHCEYFASAMTLMLRAVGIPSRMVSGFKGGQYKEEEKRLYVQQRHAHTWTEAFVDGQWLVFDPTAASDEVEETVDDSPFSLARLRGYLNNFWQTNVIGVSLARQKNTIYNPILAQMKKARTWGSDFVKAFKEETEEKAGGRKKTTIQELIFYVVSVVAVLIIIAGVLLYLYFRSAINIFGWRFSARKGSMAQQQMLLFFRRFLDIAARHGMKKSPQETAMEFAQQFERRFRHPLNAVSLNALPLALTNAYYQVRFRGDDLSPGDLDHWKKQLDTLGQALDQNR